MVGEDDVTITATTRTAERTGVEMEALTAVTGAALALYATATSLIGTDIRRLPPGLVSGAALRLGAVRVTVPQLMVVAASVALVGGLIALLRATRLA